jgi:catechol 2,3-dioxygenase-like lactoylglutathione lyase family enzyme
VVAVGYLELEAPDLEASVRFYEQALGLEVLGFGEDSRQEARQATLRMPTGQLVILTEVAFSKKGLVMSRTVPGPHLGFRVPAERWQAALDHLDALGIPHGDRGAAKVRRPGEGGTYMDDPARNVIQFITDGMD